MSEKIYEISDGEVTFWIEQEDHICIKAVTDFGDPVELSVSEVNDLADKLLKLVAMINDKN